MCSIGKLALITAWACTLGANADVIYDSKGFEEFDGFITEDGQDGWFSQGVWPYVWAGPPSRGTKSVQLRVYMAEAEISGMRRDSTDLLAAGYRVVTASFDVYRPNPEVGWFPVLEWAVGVFGNPVQGGQWPLDAPHTSLTYPFIDSYKPFEGDPWVESVVDAWAAVELTWDFDAGVASGSYNGKLVCEKPIENIDEFEGFIIVGQHGGGTPNLYYTENIWIDNFVITAEKGACYADFAGDGVLDLFDFLAYVNAFNAGDAEADCDRRANLDLFDFLCFVNAFNSGC